MRIIRHIIILLLVINVSGLPFAFHICKCRSIIRKITTEETVAEANCCCTGVSYSKENKTVNTGYHESFFPRFNLTGFDCCCSKFMFIKSKFVTILPQKITLLNTTETGYIFLNSEDAFSNIQLTSGNNMFLDLSPPHVRQIYLKTSALLI